MEAVPLGLGVLDLDREAHHYSSAQRNSLVNEFHSTELHISNTDETLVSHAPRDVRTEDLPLGPPRYPVGDDPRVHHSIFTKLVLEEVAQVTSRKSGSKLGDKYGPGFRVVWTGFFVHGVIRGSFVGRRRSPAQKG